MGFRNDLDRDEVELEKLNETYLLSWSLIGILLHLWQGMEESHALPTLIFLSPDPVFDYFRVFCDYSSYIGFL